jgi:hypothetical protein
MPTWASDPLRPLADLALSSRPCIQGQVFTTSGAPVLRLFVGAVPEGVLGAYGSSERSARELDLLECIAVDLEEHLQYLSWVGGSRGSDQCSLEAQFQESAIASAARQRLVDAGELALVLGDQEVAIRAQHRPSRPHATHTTVKVHRLPPDLRKQGVVQLLLECAGYSQQDCSVVAEYAPPLCAQDGRPLPVLRGDVVVAHVQMHHSAPLSLPRDLHFGMQRVSLQVLKPRATKPPPPQQPSTSQTPSSTPATTNQQPQQHITLNRRQRAARTRRQQEAAAAALTTTATAQPDLASHRSPSGCSVDADAAADASPAPHPAASTPSSAEPHLPAPQAGSHGLLSAAENRRLSGRSATCSGRALPSAAQGEPALDKEPTAATPLRTCDRLRRAPQPYWLVSQTHSDPLSRPTPAGAGAAQ